MISTKKYNDAMWYIYRELYKNSEPPADFDELIKNATINENGEKVIPMDDHVISLEDYDRIISNSLKKLKITNKFDIRSIKISVDIGCLPKFK